MGVTIKDIAREANVSVTTVSRVLNKKPDVSDDTKKEILKIIDELGYKPNGIARGLVLNKTYTIGLVVPDISNPYFPQVAKGVEKKAKELGYSVIFCDTDNDKEEEKKAIELLKNRRVDGIVLSLSMINKSELNKLQQENFPVVQIDREVPGLNYPTVIIDNNESAFKATKYLIQLGHTQIAHITGDLDTKTGQDRLVGFKRALKKFNIYQKEKWILEGDYSKESGFNLMKQLLESKERPTAVFAANDLMALGAYEAIFNYDLEIPEDISIIGHDDIDVASIIRPELTTMAQPKYKLGQEAARTLIEEIENNKVENKRRILLKSQLIIRNSTKEIL